MLNTQIVCPKCKTDWGYGWEDTEELKTFLAGRTTAKGKHGREGFESVKCARCKSIFKLTSLGL